MSSRMKDRPTLAELTEPATKTAPDAATRAWHDQQTREAIKEAEADDFASAEEVKTVLRKFVRDA